MKRILLIFFLLIFMFSSSVQALSWAYPFVVWNGKVYEVRHQEIVEDSKVGKILGEVKTKPNDETGSYYGNASNHYPKGTKYYEIKGTSTSESIAVEDDKVWVKAVFVHKAPFHIMNVGSNLYFIGFVVIMMLILIVVIIKNNKLKKQ